MGEKSKTILLVEDNPDVGFLIQSLFHDANLPVSFQVIKNGQEAVDYLSGKEPYVNRENYPLPVIILTNINMPHMSGFELLAWVKQHPQLKNLPVVLMSTYDDPKHLIQAASLGAYSYFIKTSSFDDLVDIAAKFVS
ncbi:response regulator [Brasilonema bromeliae]|uniref:Response regulator n=1 Tax=Brasilonema bromeliae SPC951 TaxID=385972 RepID=A0ABX1PBU9_9CYAN|nr:response regulator [Brasilonema bromeliae]NMG21341.1 response regulator [Brasilonema bromeliae SPC951]